MWTVRLPDDAVVVDPAGTVVALDIHDVPVVDDRLVPAGQVPATMSVTLRWKGGGGRRRVRGQAPAFAARLFRRVLARGTFAASEEGFTFASNAAKPVRALFAELGSEQNGVFLAAATPCARCGPTRDEVSGR